MKFSILRVKLSRLTWVSLIKFYDKIHNSYKKKKKTNVVFNSSLIMSTKQFFGFEVWTVYQTIN